MINKLKEFNNYPDHWWNSISQNHWYQYRDSIHNQYITEYSQNDMIGFKYSTIYLENKSAVSKKLKNLRFNLGMLTKIFAEGILLTKTGIELPLLLPLCVFIFLSSLHEAMKIKFTTIEIAIICAIVTNKIQSRVNNNKNIINTMNKILKQQGHMIKLKKHSFEEILYKFNKYSIIKNENGDWKILENVIIRAK
jgi:hypothetical protein